MIDSEKYARATITARRDLAPDLWIIRLKAEIDITYRSGQYVTIGLPRDGRVIERPYSICSAPTEPEIELFIERVPDGELSSPLHDVGVGGELVIRKRAKGLFLKDAPVVGQPHMLVATVTGVAPFVSLVRALRERERAGEWEPSPVLVLQGASRSLELGYADELRALASECGWVTYIPTVSRPWEDAEWDGEFGRVEDVLRKHADAAGLRNGRGAVYLCGHPGMIASARAIMRRAGLDDKDIREEQYWPD